VGTLGAHDRPIGAAAAAASAISLPLPVRSGSFVGLGGGGRGGGAGERRKGGAGGRGLGESLYADLAVSGLGPESFSAFGSRAFSVSFLFDAPLPSFRFAASSDPHRLFPY
jgi:hypothetical protein